MELWAVLQMKDIIDVTSTAPELALIEQGTHIEDC